MQTDISKDIKVQSMANQTVGAAEGKTETGLFWRKTFTETSKDTLVLVMGYGGSLRIWPATFVEKLAQKYVVITYDNRGTGLSFIPADPTEYTTEIMAGDLDQVVSHLNCGRFHLFGYSMGGCIALDYAHRYQEKVQSLFLLSSTAGGELYAKPQSEISAALANPKGTTLWEIYMSTFELMYSPAHLQRCEGAIRAIYENSRELPTSTIALRGHSYAFKNFNGSNYLADLRMPTAILSGTEDRLMPSQNSVNLVNALPNARLILIPDCEHAAHIQEESLVISEIEKHCV